VAVQNNLSLAGGLFILCVAGYYWGGFAKDTPLFMDAPDNLPDYSIIDILGTQINEQGQIVRQIQAKQLQHFTNNDEIHISAPIVTLYQQGQAHWRVSATQAISQQNNQLISLKNNVLAQRLQGLHLRLETASLTSEPAKHLLYAHLMVKSVV
jgi:LPS export ABC transporter protein LptC